MVERYTKEKILGNISMLLVASKSIESAKYLVLFCIASQNCQTSLMSLHSSRSVVASNSKQVCEYFYIESGPEGEWKCRKCGNAKAKNGGWTNLLNHLKSCLGKSYMETFLEANEARRVNKCLTSQFNM